MPTAVQTSICDVCGVQARDGSQFCYNCGSSLRSQEPQGDEPSEAVALTETANGDAGAKSKVIGGRRRRNIDRGPVEVLWEPGTGVTGSYIVGVLLILLITGALFAVAVWLK